MKIYSLNKLSEVKIIEPIVYEDDRGRSFEVSSKKILYLNGIEENFVLDYQSESLHKNTLRGIHFQNSPYAQAKIARCIK